MHVDRGRGMGGMMVVAMVATLLVPGLLQWQWQGQRLEAGQGGGSREAGGHHVGGMGGHHVGGHVGGHAGHHAPNTEVAGCGRRADGTGWRWEAGGAVAGGGVGGVDGGRRIPITLTAR